MVKMSRKTCFWTRKLELELVKFIKQRQFIWKQIGNTNINIQNKYKAYAEFAVKLGRGFTARSVRDRWVNLRSTFNHNLRRVNRSRQTAKSPKDVYVPCWPLWKPLQFLCEASKPDSTIHKQANSTQDGESTAADIKQETDSDNELNLLSLRQKTCRTSRPRNLKKSKKIYNKNKKCKQLLNNLVIAMNPLQTLIKQQKISSYWYLGRHITARLNALTPHSAFCARQDIIQLFSNSIDKTEDICMKNETNTI